MKTFSVGKTWLQGEDHKIMRELPYEWGVYWYEVGYYNGGGEMVVWDGSKLGYISLSHCSCFGPLDSVNTPSWYTVDEFFNPDSIHYHDFKPRLVRKVARLLGLEPPQTV